MNKMLIGLTSLLTLTTNSSTILTTNSHQMINNKPAIIPTSQKLTNDGIDCNIEYSDYHSLLSSWSSYQDYDNAKSYLLFDYIDYADNWNSFKQKYPTITIDTRGQAESPAIFGDVGKGKFGLLHFDTDCFKNNNEINYQYMVNVDESKLWTYYVTVKISIGFQVEASRLILIPTIYGKIDSVGAYQRALYFGLTVDRITFNVAH